MRTYNIGAPMERVALDILGPLPISTMGNKYILVIGDYFSKWTEGYAIADQESPTVARVVVEEFVARFSVPRQIHSDQGRNFESLVFQEMCKLLGMDKTRTTPLHPQSDGMIERFNQTVEAMLSKFVAENQQDWDEHLAVLMMAYRSAVHELPGSLLVNDGRSNDLPIDLLLGTPDPPEHQPEDQSEYAAKLRDRIERVHAFAWYNMLLESVRQKRSYDHRARVRQFNRGDPVWLYNPTWKKGRSPKLQRPWCGPYLVTLRLDDLVYRIQQGARTKPKVVHIDRLKAYEGQNVPTWLVTLTNESSSQNPQPVDDEEAHGPEIRGEQSLPAPEVLAIPESQSDRASVRPQRARRPPAWASSYDMS